MTGYYGEVTEDAVKLFQRTNGLSADGTVGVMTMAKLTGGDAKKAPAQPKTNTSKNNSKNNRKNNSNGGSKGNSGSTAVPNTGGASGGASGASGGGKLQAWLSVCMGLQGTELL